MASFFVNGLGEDDGKVYDSWKMTHPTIEKEHILQRDWEESMNEALDLEGSSWDVTDIVKKMEAKGWSVESVGVVKVYY
jgi:hypothetical protein